MSGTNGGPARSRTQAMVTTALSGALAVAAKAPKKASRGVALALGKAAKTQQQRLIADWLQGYLAPGTPGEEYATRLFTQLHPNVRKRFLASFVSNLMFRDPGIVEQVIEETGVKPPLLMAISPSMRCNLRCVGCYAGNYSRKDDMSFELVDRIITEAEEIGTRFFMIGGEPFMWPPLLDLIERHPDSAFQPYTNATMIDEKTADRIVELGNISLAISLEGFEKETDTRRGKGTFERVMNTMDLLRDRGAMMAFSATVTPDNIDVVTGDEWVDLMIDKGLLYGWYFTYIPVGSSPDMSIMLTPEQRNELRKGVNRVRREKPLLVADFWNDGALTGGCIAAGRRYVHISNKGDLEPCVFCHFAVDNLKEKSLVDCLGSDFMRDIRSMQPFGHNLLRPCPLIDHPSVMKNLVAKHGAYPTHEGAESLFTEIHEPLKEYARELRDVYAPVWKEEYAWADIFLNEDAEYLRRGSKGIDADEEIEEAEVPAS